MRRRVKDKGTPETGGSYKPVPIKPSSDRTQEFIPKGLYPPQEGRRRTKGVPPLYLTLTEVGDTPRTQKMRNEPNLHPGHDQNCKTNPIYTRQIYETNPITRRGTACRAPTSQNEPNFIPPPPRITRNEPNLPSRQLHIATFSAKRTQSQLGPQPKYAKRTQSHPAPRASCPQKCETNPIYHPNNQKMRNEPNFRIPSDPPTPISGKRTQSPSKPPIYELRTTNYELYYAKRTQFPPRPPTHDPKSAKRTQFPPRPPIYNPQHTIYNPNPQSQQTGEIHKS